jgi:ABC-type lipoprotein export system ATPase subunit
VVGDRWAREFAARSAANLDAPSGVHVDNCYRELAQSADRALLIVTHDLKAHAIADRADIRRDKATCNWTYT